MAVLQLRYYPDPVLTMKGQSVITFDRDLQKDVDNMFETMYDAPGVGLAAPQVGISRRFFVMDCTRKRSASSQVVIINPQIIRTEGEQNGHEACLSLPFYSSPLTRASRVVVRGQDLDGTWFDYDAVDLEARCVLHETDHCDGILYIDHLAARKKRTILRSIKERIKANEWVGEYSYS